jgi:hypothetical protein
MRKFHVSETVLFDVGSLAAPAGFDDRGDDPV